MNLRTFLLIAAVTLAAAPSARPAATEAQATIPAIKDAASELYACCYGSSSYPEKGVFSDGEPGKTVPFAWAFYVAKIGNKVTLIDTGCDPAQFGMAHIKSTRSPRQLLADLGVDPAQVHQVLITHYHFDHINNLPLFPNAAVFISRKEQDNYLNGRIYDPKLVLPAVVAVLRDAKRTHLVDQHEALSGGLEFEVVGGHTPGSAVVRFEHGGTHYILTGDECYLCANRDAQRPLGTATNKKANADFIKSIANPALVVLPCHDPVIFKRYKAVTSEIVRIF